MKAVHYENKSEPFVCMPSVQLSPTPHLHKEIEVVYVREGCAAAYADRKRYTLNKGDLFISFPNQIHYYERSVLGNYEVLIISADVFFGLKSRLFSSVPECNKIHLYDADPICDCLAHISESQGEYGMTETAGYLNLLMSRLLPRLTLKPLLLSDNSALHSILDYCCHHFTGEITLDTIAEELHLNKYYISHLLNDKLNLSFNNYINMLRINMACDLLRDTDDKISDISGDVGFGTIRSFNRAFLRLMNITPVSYREMLRVEPGQNPERQPADSYKPDSNCCCC